MKKSIGMVAALVCLTCNAMAEQRVGPFVTGMASSGDESGSAFGVGLNYEWLFNQTLGIDVHAGYLSDGDVGLIPLEFGPVVVFPSDPISITLGAGAVYGKPTDGDIDPALGFYGSAGVRCPVSDGVEWFAEAQYVSLKGDDKETTTYFRNGYSTISQPHLDISAFGLNLGVLWEF